MKCPNCGNMNPATANYCEVCGTKMPAAPSGGGAKGGTGGTGSGQVPLPPPPNVNLAFIDDLKTIRWGAIDRRYVLTWAIYNVAALFAYYVALAILAALTYRIVLNAASSYASNFLGNLLMGSSSGFGGSQGGTGGLVMLAWLVGLGLIALYGLLVGWAQSMLVRGRFPRTNWIARSVVGSFAAAIAVYLFVRIGLISITDLGDPLFLFMVLGAAFSLVQWFGMRHDVARGAWIWILGNVAAGIVLWIFYPMIGGMVGSTMAGGAMDLLQGDVSGIVLSVLVPSLIFGAIVTAVTGITMLYVFQKQTT